MLPQPFSSKGEGLQELKIRHVHTQQTYGRAGSRYLTSGVRQKS